MNIKMVEIEWDNGLYEPYYAVGRVSGIHCFTIEYFDSFYFLTSMLPGSPFYRKAFDSLEDAQYSAENILSLFISKFISVEF